MKRKWIIRVKKVKDFTVMSNHHLRDNKLSAKAMWIMSHLLSKPDDWVIRIEELIKNFKDWRDGIFTWVSELVKKWYMKKTQKRSNWKFDEVERLLYEIPPTTEKPFNGKTAYGKTAYGKSAYGKSAYGKSAYGKSDPTKYWFY